MTLCVYVPTCDRPELWALLESLCPQLTDDVRVVVSDNSPSRFGEPICEQFPVEYSHRHYNIGGDPNVLRGLTEPSDYVWIVGDDDPLLPDAVQNVLEAIEDRPDRIVLTTPEVPLAPFSGSIQDWVAGMADKSILIAATLITANVYRNACLDVEVGLRKLDTHYPVSWAALGCQTVATIPEPAFLVGCEHGQPMPEARRVWREYLDAFAWTYDLPPIPFRDCLRWNFPEKALAAV